MAKITNRFVHFKTKASFTSRLGAGDIQESSVVFIQDANEIWTHGTYYKCDISEAEVIALINSKGYITEADIPSLTGGASATSGQYVSGVTVSGHNVTVTKAALPTNAETATKLATPRVIAIAGAISGSTTFDGSRNVSINSTLNSFDASKITSGTLNADRLPEIPISKIPAAAMERLYVVESQSAAVALKIQEGDVVQIGSGGPMYFCISESASTFATKFKVFTAGAATSVPWSGVLNKPSIPEAAVDSPTRIDGSKSAAVGTSSKYAKEDHIHSTNTRMLNLNGTSYTFHSDSSSNLPMVYAPTSTGTSGQILKSTGGVPTWSDLTVNIDKVSDVTKGYWTYGDIPGGMRSFINEYRGDHLAFTPKEDILVEVSSNNGASWETKETTDAIASIFNSLNTEGFSTFTDVNTLTTDYKFRLTLTNSDRYCTITWLYLWISTNGGGYSLDVERYSEAKEWETIASDKTLSGWSGGNYISFTDKITYNSSPRITTQQSKIRLTFNVKSVNSSYKSNIHIYRISGYGDFLWKYSNKNYLAAYGTIHTWDSNKTVIFPAAIKVPGAISTETGVTTPSLTVNGDIGCNSIKIGSRSLNNALVFTSLNNIDYTQSTKTAKEEEIVTSAALAYWNGAYSGTSSSLRYCTSGEIASTSWVKSNYILNTGGSITGPLTISAEADAKIILDNTDDETNYQQIAFAQDGVIYGRLGTYGTTDIKWNQATLATQNWVSSQGYLTSVSWNTITGKPSTFTPSAHNQASNTITALTGYTKGTSTADLAVTDTLNTALGKLECQIATKTSNTGTVTSVKMTVPTGLSVSGSPITTSGTLALTYASGYSIPTTAKQTNWDTAYGWGNHASAGYLKTIPAATSSSYGGIQIGYTTSGKNYAVELSNGKAYVNVPWTSYSIANASTAGLVKPINVITKPSINSITTTSGRYYSVQMSSDGNMFVNVPWVQGSSNPGTVTSITAGAGLTGGTITSSGTIKAKLRTEDLMSLDSINASSTSNRVYAVQQDKSGYLAVSVPWTDTNTDTKVTSVANHYTPSGGTTLSASGGSSLTAGSSQVVTGITKDAAGHVTGITSGSLPAAPTLSGLGGIGTVSASGTAPLTLSASKSGTSVTITGSVAAASSSSSGVVSTGTQTFAGEKTFSSEIQAIGGISSKNIIHIDDGTYTGYLGNLDSIGLGSGDSFAVVSEGKLTLMTINDSPIYFGQNEDCNITGSHFSGSAETANKVVGSLTIDGTAYNGSSNVTVNTKLLQGNNARSIIKAGYSYSGCNSSITSISGFSYNNPDAVVASSTKITSFPSNVRKMANIANLSGTYYVYCFSYIGGYVYVNGAVYA